ncbi:MAG: hypothetical protein E7293_01420 [Lachnospiraceae bacterium]|nr:hypothetical protein [Lachnospiraceae bacterium]
MTETKKKKLPIFWILYILFGLLLIGFWIYVLSYVNRCLIAYESSQPEHVIQAFVKRLENGEVEELFSFSSTQNRFEDIDLAKKRYIDGLSGSDITYEKAPGNYNAQEPSYDLYVKDDHIATVTLQETASTPLMFILAAQEWDVLSAVPILEVPQNSITVCIPDTYTLTVNGIPADQRELTGREWDMEQFQYSAEYVTVPKLVEYRITDLFDTPEVEIRDAYGNNMAYTEENGVIQVSDFASMQMDAELADYVLQNAIDYSNFFSRDLEGCRASVEPISHMFPENSYYLELADNYRKHDMWMYSSHHAPAFSNEKVSDYVRYSEDLFSCSVYFEKNMVLISTGAKRVDVTNTRFYYAKLDDRWVIVDMQTILE